MTRADLDRTAELHDGWLGLKSKSTVNNLIGGQSEQKFLSETCRTKIFMSFFDETDENVAFEHGHLSHVRDKSVSSRQVGLVLMPFATCTLS